MLIRYKTQISNPLLKLPDAYRIQLQNLLEHLVGINNHSFKINYRESYIFTNPEEIENDNIISKRENDVKFQQLLNSNSIQFCPDIDSSRQCEISTDLRNTANPQQKYLLDFIENYLHYLLNHSRRPSEVAKPKPFHIVVNGLAGSGKSYVINIIEKMLREYCIAETASVSRPRKNCGLLKMAHTGKAALNIRVSTIHSALEIVYLHWLVSEYIFMF